MKKKTPGHAVVVKLVQIKWVMIDMQGKYISWHSLTGVNDGVVKLVSEQNQIGLHTYLSSLR